MRKKICILAFEPVASEKRILRQVNLANKLFQVDVISIKKWSHPKNIKYFKLERTQRSFFFMLIFGIKLIIGKLFPSSYENVFWLKKEYSQALNILKKENYDLIHANDWDGLPVAIHGSHGKKTKVLFDAHEYTPEQNSDNWLIRTFVIPFRVYMLRKYYSNDIKMITVGKGISNLYKENFGWEPDSILNTSYYEKTAFHKVNPEKIKLIHHGWAIKGRYLEELIKMMRFLDDRFHLYFMLLSRENDNYFKKLQSLSQKISKECITFLPPVSPGVLTQEINKFDIGIHYLNTKNANHLYALPNKFFDYILAGLGVVIPPLPAMAEIIREHGIGRVAQSQSPKDMADMLNALTTDEINQFKHNSLALAKVYNAEHEMAKLSDIYSELLNKQ